MFQIVSLFLLSFLFLIYCSMCYNLLLEKLLSDKKLMNENPLVMVFYKISKTTFLNFAKYNYFLNERVSKLWNC